MNPQPSVQHAMRILLPLLLLAPVVASADTLVFLNGDRLNGAFLDAPNATTIRWQISPDQDPVNIPLAAVHRVVFDSAPEAPAPEDETSLHLELTNGNSLHGRFVAVEEDAVGIESDLFGSLRVPRPMIESIHVNKGGYYLLSKPGPAREWRVNRRRSWNIRNSDLVSRDYGTIARETPAADRIRIGFDILGDDPAAGLTLHFFVANPERVNSDAHFSVQFSGNFAYARRAIAQERDGRNNAARVSTEAIGEPQSYERRSTAGSMRVDIYADARKGLILLHIDGREVARWNDPRGLGEGHGGIGFSNNNQNTTIIRNLTVSRWQGIADPPDDIPEGVDVTILRNDDVLVGPVLGLRDGSIEIETTLFGPLKVPTDRVHNIILASQSRQRPRYMDGDALVTFHHGGRLTLQVKDISDGRITGFSELCGPATLNLAGVARIDFLHSYQELLDSPDDINATRPESLLEPNW